MDIQRKSSSATSSDTHRKGKGKGKGKLKVVYISTPMKVRTSAARFRSLVQQLTGKNSDIAPYLDSHEGATLGFCDHDGVLLPDRVLSSTTAYLDSFLENVLMSRMEVDRFFSFSDVISHSNVMDVYDNFIV